MTARGKGKPGPLQRRRRASDGYRAAGYVTAMNDIMKLLESELDRTGDDPVAVLLSVGRVAAAAVEVYRIDTVPREWTAEWMDEWVSAPGSPLAGYGGSG